MEREEGSSDRVVIGEERMGAVGGIRAYGADKPKHWGSIGTLEESRDYFRNHYMKNVGELSR